VAHHVTKTNVDGSYKGMHGPASQKKLLVREAVSVSEATSLSGADCLPNRELPHFRETHMCYHVPSRQASFSMRAACDGEIFLG
jgi:hypothetical protein